MSKTIWLLMCLLSILGCSTAAHKRNAQWKQDFTYVKMVRTTFAESASLNFDCTGYEASTSRTTKDKKKPEPQTPATKKFNWADQVRCYMQDSTKTPQQKAALRNWVIESFVTLVNHAYGDFEHDSVFSREASSTALEAVNLGLAAGSAVFGGTSFGAASTATQGFQHSVDKNFYNSETAFVINGKMQAIRLEQLTKIREREALPVDCPTPTAPESGESTEQKGSQPRCYTVSEAMNDVQELFYAGTVHRALQDISNQTSAQTNAAQNKLKTLNNQDVPTSTNTTPAIQKPGAEEPKPTPSPEKPK
jgi:hypothetical protein